LKICCRGASVPEYRLFSPVIAAFHFVTALLFSILLDVQNGEQLVRHTWHHPQQREMMTWIATSSDGFKNRRGIGKQGDFTFS
jgi:hypothetical protein